MFNLILFCCHFIDDPICKDFIQIRDMSSEQVLFSGCTEYTKPIEVLSQSNELQVSTMS